jgi:hypothetical protein
MIAPLHSPMNNDRLGMLLRRVGRDLKGEPGFWNFTLDHVRITCITDEAQDRMRIIAPVAGMNAVRPDDLRKCMEANFHRALDARYCIYQDRLWSAFIHPLSELSEELLFSAIDQVAELVKTFGTTFSSGGLVFKEA